MKSQRTDKPHILVVDDARDIRESLEQYLKHHDFEVSLAESAVEARPQIASERIDVVILDVMMPGEDGLSLCRWLAENTLIPVILLTAMATDTDKIVGLEVGADHYVVKPFNPRVLLALIRAILRRTPEQALPQDNQVRKFTNWIHDTGSALLTHEDGQQLKLTSAENRLLSIFLDSPNKIINRGTLFERVMHREEKAFDRAVDNLIGRLRKKLEVDPSNPKILVTEWGMGYKLITDVQNVERP